MINAESPKWFKEALAKEPEKLSMKVKGATITYNAWGDKKNPGILFVHGGMAHADWWSFIAPYFLETHRVIALNLGGMGDSTWRKEYSTELWGEEIVKVCEKEKLKKTIIVGHSLGGLCCVVAASQFKSKLYGLVIVDTAIVPPSKVPDKLDFKIKANKIYKSVNDAKSRFRLVPPQGEGLDYIMEYIADKSLKQVKNGWTWKFDPQYMKMFTASGFKKRQEIYSKKLQALKCRVAVFRGEKSFFFQGGTDKYMHELLDKKSPIISIPEAHHHIMVDQPLALISALRALVIDWDHSKPEKST